MGSRLSVSPFARRGYRGLWLLLAITVGCGRFAQESPPKLGSTNWQIRGMGGPVELRPLPRATEVVADYEKWLGSESSVTVKARLYEATLVGASNQLKFGVQILKGDTPMGQSVTTLATFIYRDPSDGDYELSWGRSGRHGADFLRLTDQPKRVWLQPNLGTNAAGNPMLEIVAFEGLEGTRGAAALPGEKRIP